MIPMLVMTSSASTQATSPGTSAVSSASRSLNWDHLGGHCRVHGRPYVTWPRSGDAVGDSDECLVYGAMVASVEDKDLRPFRDVSSQTYYKPVGIGSGHSHLPVGETEARGEFLGCKDGVLRGEHQGDSPPQLLGDRIHGGRRRVPGHGAGIAQAEVQVTDAIHVGEIGAAGFGYEHWVRTRPASHPIHGNTVEKMGSGTLEEL